MSKWKIVKLGEVFSLIRNGANIKQGVIDGGYPISRIETISNGEIDRNKMGYAGIDNISKYSGYVLQNGDILMSHINSEKHLGKTACYKQKQGEIIIHGMNLLCLRPIERLINYKYTYYFFQSNIFKKQIPKITKKSVNQASFTVNALKGLTFLLPPLETQKQIAKTLDTAVELLAMRKQQLAELDDLIKSIFYDMFGDSVTNEKGWEVEELGNISDIQGGLQVTGKRVNNPIELPYLRVANIYRDLLDLREIKTIKVTEAEAERVCLKRGDILIVEGHGNPTEIGRCAVWDGSIQVCLHQNHLIRVRVDAEYALPAFISYYINSESGRQQMFKAGKTTSGLNTISSKNVRETLVLLPPLSLQNKFGCIVTKIEEQKSLVKKAIYQTQYLIDSIMSNYFE